MGVGIATEALVGDGIATEAAGGHWYSHWTSVIHFASLYER